jgi:predicted amidohydrolase YtcJ
VTTATATTDDPNVKLAFARVAIATALASYREQEATAVRAGDHLGALTYGTAADALKFAMRTVS